MLPLAHLGHWLWVLYVLPVLIVIAGIVKSTLSERRRASAHPAGSGRDSRATDDDPPGG